MKLTFDKGWFFPALILASIGLTGILFQYLPNMTTLATDLIRTAMAITVFFLVDKYVMNEVDTIEELKKGNIAYAVFVLSYAIVIGLASSSL